MSREDEDLYDEVDCSDEHSLQEACAAVRQEVEDSPDWLKSIHKQNEGLRGLAARESQPPVSKDEEKEPLTPDEKFELLQEAMTAIISAMREQNYALDYAGSSCLREYEQDTLAEYQEAASNFLCTGEKLLSKLTEDNE